MSHNEGDWKPNGRPQSTIARSFSAALHDAFMIDNSLDGLAKSVDQKKKAISSQSAELQALEVRLRETEERLKERQSKSSSPALGGSAYSSPHRRPPIGRTFSGQENDRRQARAYNPPATQPLSQARPPNAKMGSYSRPIVPGGTPETRQDNPSPDCVMVDQTADGQKDQ